MPDQLRPGDIWQHKGMSRLYVTDEDRDLHPGYLKCYWAMGGNANAPWTFMDPRRTDEFFPEGVPWQIVPLVQRAFELWATPLQTSPTGATMDPSGGSLSDQPASSI